MPESLWNSQAVEEAQQDKPTAEPVAEQATEPVAEAAADSASEASAAALSVDEFSALEERVLRTVNLVKQERQARAAAEERAANAEAKLQEQAPLADRLQAEVSALQEERGHVRQRVERLLAQLDALEL
ncbi:MAG: hypothetical protein ABR991_00380 [Terracidiphilus sp.]|jgi:phage-related minor tail protein